MPLRMCVKEGGGYRPRRGQAGMALRVLYDACDVLSWRRDDDGRHDWSPIDMVDVSCHTGRRHWTCDEEERLPLQTNTLSSARP